MKPAASGELGNAQETKLHTEAAQKLAAHNDEVCSDTINTRRMYDDIEQFGLDYGPSFQNIAYLRSAEKQHLVFANVVVSDTAQLMPHSFEYLRIGHPVTLDSVLQTTFPALSSCDKVLTSTLAPTSIRRMRIANRTCSSPGQVLNVASCAVWKGFHHADAVFWSSSS